MWLVSVGDGTFHLTSHLFINEIKDSHGAMMIAKDRPTVKVEETNGLAPQPLSFPFLSLLTSAAWVWGSVCLQPGSGAI